MSVVNVPIGILVMLLAARVLAARVLAAGRAWRRWRDGADWLGAFLVTAGLMAGVYVIVGSSGYGWGSARTLGGGRRRRGPARRVRDPPGDGPYALLPLRLFSVRATGRGQPRAVPGDRRRVRVPGHDHAVHAARPRLQRGRVRAGPAPHGGGHRHGSARRVRPPRRPHRPARDAAGRAGPHRRRAGPADPGPGARELSGAPAPAVADLRRGRRACPCPPWPSLGMSAATPNDAGLASGLFNTTQQIGAAWAWQCCPPWPPRRRAADAAGQAPPRWPPVTAWPSPAARGCRDGDVVAAAVLG